MHDHASDLNAAAAAPSAPTPPVRRGRSFKRVLFGLWASVVLFYVLNSLVTYWYGIEIRAIPGGPLPLSRHHLRLSIVRGVTCVKVHVPRARPQEDYPASVLWQFALPRVQGDTYPPNGIQRMPVRARWDNGFGFAFVVIDLFPNYPSKVGAEMSYFYAAAPHWFVLTILVGPAVRPLLRAHRRRSRASQGRCLTCGYDLRASTGRCSECGAPSPPRASEPSETAAASDPHPVAHAAQGTEWTPDDPLERIPGGALGAFRRSLKGSGQCGNLLRSSAPDATAPVRRQSGSDARRVRPHGRIRRRLTRVLVGTWACVVLFYVVDSVAGYWYGIEVTALLTGPLPLNYQQLRLSIVRGVTCFYVQDLGMLPPKGGEPPEITVRFSLPPVVGDSYPPNTLQRVPVRARWGNGLGFLYAAGTLPTNEYTVGLKLDYSYVAVPHWFVLALLVGPALRPLLRAYRRRYRIWKGPSPSCAYDQPGRTRDRAERRTTTATGYDAVTTGPTEVGRGRAPDTAA